jgi:glucose/arabinose dehydrogenase
MLKWGIGAGVGAVLAIAGTTAVADVTVNLEEVASGLTAPMMMVQPPGDDRRFIAEQIGLVKILTADGEVLEEPFLDIRHRLIDQWPEFDEKGLLGIAFHPDFANNGKFYVAYSQPTHWLGALDKHFWWDHTNVIEEYTVSADDPDVADPNTVRQITAIDWPQFNHNGHWIGFGPDGYLYISTGDGGYANDWGIGHNVLEGNGQDLLSLHGKMLRIDVNGSSGGQNYAIPADNPFAGQEGTALPEIYAYGLRNPWRCSFDMGGDNQLFCGDVQQNSYEEVSIIEKGGNHGWRRMEATHCFDFEDPNNHPADCDKSGLVLPILEYKNCTAQPDGCWGISVTGGYVYRGGVAEWDGKYIFGDWSKSFAARDGQLFIATKGGDSKWTLEHLNVANMDGELPYVLAFAQDADGEVYVLTSVTTGPVGGLDKIYRIVPAQ